MKKLDRLGWAAAMAFRAFNVKIGVRVSAKQVLNSVRDHLPFGWERQRDRTVDRLYSIVVGGDTPNSSTKRFSLLYADVRLIARTLKLEDIFIAMQSDMESYIAQRARKLFVHAGVVSWNGSAIVIPGPSLSGKTTLVKALLEAGADYCSDEFAVFDERGKVHSFARPLSVRTDEKTALRVQAESLGAQTSKQPLSLGLVVLTKYKSGARWKPKAVTPGQGALGLMANTIVARKHPAKTLMILSRAVSQATVLSSLRGEASEAAALILREVKQKTPATQGQEYETEIRPNL
jgi:hypothetical protein